jgi:hypothetical protein
MSGRRVAGVAHLEFPMASATSFETKEKNERTILIKVSILVSRTILQFNK